MADLKISQFSDGGTVETGDEIATNRAGVNTKVRVGTGATLDANNQIGGLPLLEDVGGSPALPAIDGSQLLNVSSGSAKIDAADSEGGYLAEKLVPGRQIRADIDTDSDGFKTLSFGVRNLFASPVTAGSGTVTINFSDGDYHTVTATGVFSFAWSMQNGEAVMVRAIDFDANAPVDNLDWGDAGIPDWQGNDDFIVYRDTNGRYIGVLVALGVL